MVLIEVSGISMFKDEALEHDQFVQMRRWELDKLKDWSAA